MKGCVTEFWPELTCALPMADNPSHRNTGHETLPLNKGWIVPVVNWSQLTRSHYKEISLTKEKQRVFD